MNLSNHTILVVEDNPAHLTHLSALLRKRGYQVCGAQDSDEAIDLLQTFHFHMVFMDMTLPSMDGLDTCTVMRTHEQLRDVPVIITLEDHPRTAPTMPDTLINGYLSKPVFEPQLDATLAKSLEKEAMHA